MKITSKYENWCVGYYDRAYCKEKIQEFKNRQYKDARIGSSKKSYNGQTYYRIQVLDWTLSDIEHYGVDFDKLMDVGQFIAKMSNAKLIGDFSIVKNESDNFVIEYMLLQEDYTSYKTKIEIQDILELIQKNFN